MKNNKGFSLVELIVVIAIMAILASVAVIGVSVYVPKAQKAADEQMVADIQKAVDLYSGLEGDMTKYAGQSGYIVIKQNGGVDIGGSTVDMDQMVNEAIVATFGEDYDDELKVSYKGWPSVFTNAEANAINSSSYFGSHTNAQGQTVHNTKDLMQTVEMLTGALKGYTNGTSAEANKAVLDVAANMSDKSIVNTEAFIAWWKNLDSGLPSDGVQFNFPDGTDVMDIAKTALAAQYAQYKGYVLSTNCLECIATFNNADSFNHLNPDLPSDQAAQAALSEIIVNTTNHVMGDLDNPEDGCSKCQAAMAAYPNGNAENDAKAYIALLGQVNNMSSIIQSRPEFQQDGLYTSDYVSSVVNEYVVTVNSYASANANVGDIVVSVYVDTNGKITFFHNLSE